MMKKTVFRIFIASILLGAAAYGYFFLQDQKKPSNLYFIHPFFKQFQRESNITYLGVRHNLSPWNDPLFKNIRSKYIVPFNIQKTPDTPVSVNEARCIVVSLAQKIQDLILQDPAASIQLGDTAFTSGDVQVNLYFLNDLLLMQNGVAIASIMNGKIIYEKYTVTQEEFPYPVGKLSLMQEESFTEGLEIVKSQGCLYNIFN